jgi:hypothetical protein
MADADDAVRRFEDSWQIDRERPMHKIILEAAMQELLFSSDDRQHDHAKWKDEVRRRLREELGVDPLIYTETDLQNLMNPPPSREP